MVIQAMDFYQPLNIDIYGPDLLKSLFCPDFQINADLPMVQDFNKVGNFVFFVRTAEL